MSTKNYEPTFPELADSTLLITGGTGFFGQSILSNLPMLLPGSCKVTIISRNASAFLKQFPHYASLKQLTFANADTACRNSLPTGNFDYIIHAATPCAATAKPGSIRSFTLKSAENIIALATGSGTKRILFTSSGAVYGPAQTDVERFSEDNLCSPLTEYGRAKFDAEKEFSKSPIPSVIARCFAFAGPHLPLLSSFAFGNFIGNALAGQPIIIRGNGRAIRSYLYESELAKWMFTILLHGNDYDIFNVGGNRAVSILQLAELIRELINPSIPVVVSNRNPVLPYQDRYLPDLSKVAAKLQLHPLITLEQAIISTAYPGEQTMA